MKTRITIVGMIVLQAAVLMAEESKTGGTGQAPAQQGRAPVLYDTLDALPAAGVAQFKIDAEKWKKVPDTAATGIKGDAVLCTQCAAAVVRKDGNGVDLYAQTTNGWVHRARLTPVAGEGTMKFAGTASVPGDGSTAGVTVKLQGAGFGSLELSLAAGSPLLNATPKGKVEGIRITAPSRWGVLPDFFTDDLMVDARQMATPRAEIPIEHMYLQMLGNGDSILSVFCDKNERDIRVSLSGEAENRVIEAADIFFGGAGAAIWVGTMEQKGIWHSRELSKDENLKGVTLDWDVPFEANWKADFTQTGGDIHSDAVNSLQWGGHQWVKWDGKAAKRGALVIPGDPKARGYAFEGPLVVYPLRRNDRTPLDALLLDDFMRLSLGSGPCAFILDVSGRTHGMNKGIFTCSYDWTIPRIMTNNREDMNLFKEERVLLRHIHKAVLTFMEFIESRIGWYAEFRKDMLAMLGEREKNNPDLAEFIGKMKKIVSSLPEKAPTGSKRIAPNLQVVEKAVLVDTPYQIGPSLQAAKTPPSVAEPQDNQLADCRRIVKILRARAISEFVKNPALSKNPAAAEIVKEIREKSQAVLHGPASHEGWETW